MSRPRPLVLVLVVVSLSLGAGCKGSSSSPTSGTSVPAALRVLDGGTPELVFGDRTIALPAGELETGARPVVMQEEGGKRFAYLSATGDVRIVHVIAGTTYLGPKTNAPIDFKTAPDLDRSLGPLFENAGPRRAQLIADVTKEKGEAAVARMLAASAHVDAPEWDAAFAKLSEASAAEVKRGLAGLLEKDKPTAGLKRAVARVPLREPARAPALAARVRELNDPVREPRAAAVMLRALAAVDKAQAAVVACDVIAVAPPDTDHAGREAVVEAALVAIAAARSDCPHVAKHLGEDACLPYFRCNDEGPLSGRETSKQDEPLCTTEQLGRAIAQELERSPADVLAMASGTRPHLFAFAALTSTGKVPAPFVTAHARRRYALVQPKDPACDTGVAPGAPCRCDEATLRDQVCRQSEGNSVHVAVCKVEIDDKQKKLLNVVAAVPQ